MAYTVALSMLSPSGRSLAGGKGANLASLIQAAFPVPPGLVITTEAYAHFVAHNQLQEELARLVGGVDPLKPEAFDVASEAIRALFEKGEISPGLREALLAAYEQLDASAMAVRSSATEEDLPSASFAGQQESYLNVRGPGAFLQAVVRCWSSLWTARAMSYRQRQRIAPEQVSMAVVVQTMLPADASGVLFTTNPVTGSRAEMVLNAAWGLGEALVSGQVTPDSFTLSRDDGSLKQTMTAEKMFALVATEQEVVERALSGEQQRQATLTEAHIARLYQLGQAIEEHFQAPQDIEWVRVGEEIFIVQARPITAQPSMQTVTVPQERLFVPGDDAWDRRQPQPAPQPYDIWTRTNMGENFPFPITPYTSSLWPVIYMLNRVPGHEERAANPALEQSMRRFYGRVYINEGQLIHTYTQLGIPRAFSDITWGSRQRGKEPGCERFSLLKLVGGLAGVMKAMRSQATPKPKKPTKPVGEEIPSLKGALFYTTIDSWVSDFQHRDLGQFDDQELWRYWMTRWPYRATKLGAVMLTAVQTAFLLYQLEVRLRKWTGREGLATRLLQGLAGIETAEVAPALWHMVQTLRELELAHVLSGETPANALRILQQCAESEPFQRQLQAFLERHGFRCPNDAEMYNGRWGEEPELVIEMLKDYLDLDPSYSPQEVQCRQERERDQLESEIAGQLNSFQRGIFRWLLTQTRASTRRRDNNRSYVAKFLYPMRLLALELGRRWTERGWLSHPNDIFFLSVYEIDDLIQSGDPLALGKPLSQLCTERRTAFDYWHTIQPPEALGPGGEPLPPLEQGQPFLQGLTASGGRVRGTARVVHTIAEARQLRKGDILVTSATDPGWTPLFPLISGLVLEIGGQLSHGAIIAREYGIPAAINVPNALQAISDGQTIILDGDSGRVFLDYGEIVASGTPEATQFVGQA